MLVLTNSKSCFFVCVVFFVVVCLVFVFLICQDIAYGAHMPPDDYPCYNPMLDIMIPYKKLPVPIVKKNSYPHFFPTTS